MLDHGLNDVSHGHRDICKVLKRGGDDEWGLSLVMEDQEPSTWPDPGSG
jgi:hypothetical protein